MHQDWTEDTYVKVAEAVISAIPHRPILEMVLEKSRDQKMNELIRSKMSSGKSNNPVKTQDSIEYGLDSTPASTPAKTSVKTTSEESSDEYDDLFKDL